MGRVRGGKLSIFAWYNARVFSGQRPEHDENESSSGVDDAIEADEDSDEDSDDVIQPDDVRGDGFGRFGDMASSIGRNSAVSCTIPSLSQNLHNIKLVNHNLVQGSHGQLHRTGVESEIPMIVSCGMPYFDLKLIPQFL